MSTLRIAFIAACLTPWVAPADPPAPAPVGVSVDQVVAARQAAMVMSGFTLDLMAKATDRGGDLKKQGYPAYALATWAKALPSMFPTGSGPDASSAKMTAKSEVWSDRAGYDKAAQDFIAATKRLRDLAKAGDLPGFKSQLSVVQKSCDECHQDYKN
jgi:cytochrome c556